MQDEHGNPADTAAHLPPVATLTLPGASATVKALEQASGLWQLDLSFWPLIFPTAAVPAGTPVDLFLPCTVHLQRNHTKFSTLTLQVSILEPLIASTDQLAAFVTGVTDKPQMRRHRITAGVQSHLLATLANATTGRSGQLALVPCIQSCHDGNVDSCLNRLLLQSCTQCSALRAGMAPWTMHAPRGSDADSATLGT